MKRLLRITLRVTILLFLLLNISAAFHAYKFTHYYEADEVLPIPQEQKTTLQKLSEIFFGAKYAKKPNPPLDSFFTQITFSTSGGLKLAASYAKVDSARGTVILFHGHGGNRFGVINEAHAFRRIGYNILLLDFRAHGNSEGNTCTIGFDEAEDVNLAFNYIKDSGEKNIILWGISLGAATITRAIDKYDLEPRKIILELPFASIHQAVKSRVRMMGLPAQPISMLLTFWGGVENGFWAFSHKPAAYAKSIKCPVLLQFGRTDNRVSVEEAEEIFGNISAPKSMIFYENSGHVSLCKNENGKWVNTVSAFLAQP